MRIIKCDFCGAQMEDPIVSLKEVTPWQMGWVIIDGKDGKQDACSLCKEKLNAVSAQKEE